MIGVGLNKPARSRVLGTMVAYGFARGHLETDLGIAAWMGAEVLEILPDWRSLPDPEFLRRRVEDAGVRVHSVHGCWGGQSIKAARVDLGSIDPETSSASIDDIKRCIDWTTAAGGSFLVVHPGGLSEPEDAIRRAESLRMSLETLGAPALAAGVTLCVENMPPGVFPGSSMAELFSLVSEVAHSAVGLAIDTGHANINADASGETRAAGALLRSTHVHDNDGRADSHLPPGFGTIDWVAWRDTLDEIGYSGPVMLECIRYLREHPESRTEALRARLDFLTGSTDDAGACEVAG